MLVSFPLLAQVNTVITYGNGVWSDRDTAAGSLAVLKMQLKDRFSADDFDQIEFYLAYNTTEGKAKDLWEAAVQLGTLTVSNYFRLLSKIDPLPDDLQQAYINLATSFDETQLTNEDVQEHVGKYKEFIASGKWVVIVPHSQVNYIASLSYNNLIGNEQQYVRIESVANVGGFPADGRLIYTTSAADIVTAATFSLGKSLPANVLNPASSDEPTGHYFVESYLKYCNPSREKIIDNIWATFYNTPIPPPISCSTVFSIGDLVEIVPIVTALVFDTANGGVKCGLFT